MAVWLWDENESVEKRRVFLRSYHFSRKRSCGDKVRLTLIRIRRLITCYRFGAMHKLRRCFMWFRLRCRWPLCRTFHRLQVHPPRPAPASFAP